MLLVRVRIFYGVRKPNSITKQIFLICWSYSDRNRNVCILIHFPINVISNDFAGYISIILYDNNGNHLSENVGNFFSTEIWMAQYSMLFIPIEFVRHHFMLIQHHWKSSPTIEWKETTHTSIYITLFLSLLEVSYRPVNWECKNHTMKTRLPMNTIEMAAVNAIIQLLCTPLTVNCHHNLM